MVIAEMGELVVIECSQRFDRTVFSRLFFKIHDNLLLLVAFHHYLARPIFAQ
jgi:hypothetical protein